MSIATELQRIQGAKADIKASIELKGVSIPASALIDDYSGYVDQISGGGTKDYIIEGTEYDPTATYSGAFDPKPQIVSVTIPSGFTSIGNSAFQNCRGLTSITIPNTVTSIGNYAFSGCSGLTSITIPNTVTSIGNNAFQSCTGLTAITIPNSVTNINGYTFQSCTGLTSVTIGSGITEIGYACFQGCGLTSVTIPSGVTLIGGNAFYNCHSLTSITVLATTPPTLANANAFNNTTCPIYVPAESLTAYQTAWSAYASRIQAIPNP